MDFDSFLVVAHHAFLFRVAFGRPGAAVHSNAIFAQPEADLWSNTGALNDAPEKGDDYAFRLVRYLLDAEQSIGMTNVLVVGMGKTGTTILASVIAKSIPSAQLFMEPAKVAPFERLAKLQGSWVVKLLYEHWMQRPSLLSGIVRGETGFRPDRIVAIVRDPRDGLISVLLYSAYEHVMQGASRAQVSQWLEILREKEADPRKHSVLDLLEHANRIFGTRYAPGFFFESFNAYIAWLRDHRERLYVLRYEDFVLEMTAELSAYLGIEVASSREVVPGYERVARTKLAGDWRRMMLPDDVACWRGRYGQELQSQGYGDWELRAEPIDPGAGSEYVARITEEAFARRATAKQAEAAG